MTHKENENIDSLLDDDDNAAKEHQDDASSSVPNVEPQVTPPLQPVTPNNLANLNLTQIVALLQNNLLQNQGNNGSQALGMSDTGTDFLVSKKVVDPTAFASNLKCDDAQEDSM